MRWTGAGRAILPIAALLGVAIAPASACVSAGDPCDAHHSPNTSRLGALPQSITILRETKIGPGGCDSNAFTLWAITDGSGDSAVLLDRYAMTVLDQGGWSRSDRFSPIVDLSSPQRGLLVELITAANEQTLEALDRAHQPRFKGDTLPTEPPSFPSPVYVDWTIEALIGQAVEHRTALVIVSIRWCGGRVACA